ncbi:MAG: HlyD family secretion protein [Candidatus Obscuribacterales bacterium]|jgi:membrane fusion protein (multidrug efflux system)|nr:HlyD family secretion protein [Candidatus Obscuribacterales bacterium]
MSAHLNVNKHLTSALKQSLKNTLNHAPESTCAKGNEAIAQASAPGIDTAEAELHPALTVISNFSRHTRLGSQQNLCQRTTSSKRSEAVEETGSLKAAQPISDNEEEEKEQAEISSRDVKESASSHKWVKRAAIFALLSLVMLATGIAGKNVFEHFSSFQETDDAYVTGHLHQISSRVSGTVQQVLIDDNQHVKAGQPLLLLDPKDFLIKIEAAKADLKQAEQQVTVASSSIVMADATEKGESTNAQGSISEALAGIAGAEASVQQAQSQISAARADVKAKEAELERAKSDLGRYDALLEQGAVSTQQKDFALRDYKVAQENYNVAKDHLLHAVAGLARSQQSIESAKAQLVRSQAQVHMAKASSVQTVINQNQHHVALAAVEKAKAALSEAEQNLKYTVIPAPTSGRVGNKTVEVGQRVNPGQALLSIVSDKPWVVANFKETQLNKMKIGQPVEIKIDSFPEHTFEGHIASFAPASGASFSIIRSDNATGNFTKIVQRIPVKIMLTPQSVLGYEDRIVPGMSVVAAVQLKSQAAKSATTIAHHAGH